MTGHGLDITYLQSLLKLGHEFFQLPQETKDQIHIFKSQDGVRGYQKIGENVTYAKRDQQEVCPCDRKGAYEIGPGHLPRTIFPFFGKARGVTVMA